MTRLSARLLSGAILCALAASLWAAEESARSSNVDRQIQDAQTLQAAGKLDEAWKAYGSLREELQKGAPSSQLGFVLNEMSKIASGRGEYDAAVKLAQESASVYHTIGEQKGESHAINIKGLAEVARGDYVSARQDFTTALALSRAVHDTENEVQVLNNLGSAYYFEGKYLEAMRSYESAMKTVDQIESEKWREYWRQVTDFNQATLYQRLGRYETALEIYRRVESSSKALTSSDRAHLAANLGTLYRRLGDPWKALENYQKAQSLFSKDRDADGEIGVLKNIGIVYALELNDLHDAQAIFARVLALAAKTSNRREEMQAHLYLGETYLLKHSLERAGAEFDSARRTAEELGTTEEQWKALYGLGQAQERAGSLPEAEARYRKAVSIIEKARVQLQLSALRAEFLGDKRSVYDALISLLLRRNATEEAFLFLERSRARNFQDRFASSKTGEAAPLTMEEVRGRLDPGTALLEYWTAGNQIAVLWCTRDRFGVTVKETTPVEQRTMHALLDAIPEGPGDWRTRIAGLSSLLPRDWLDSDPAISHVVIVPDNWLGMVPFDLLPIADSKRLLIEQADVSYLPSAVLLRRKSLEVNRSLFPWLRELVAFGDPVVRQGAQTSTGLLSQGVQPLPFSVEEIHSIAAMTPGRSEIFLGPDNRKSTFLSGKANSALLLHVSTHAFADDLNPEDSRLLFSAEGTNEGLGDFLFLRELYDLDLSNVRMAVLSACDTERGRLVRGEGVQAFSRALLAAGSRSSLTTLWRVDDRATAEFMKQFYYFAVKRRMAKAEALRQAKLKFLRSQSGYENPKYWAAFVISGDALTPVPEVLSWTTLAFLASSALASVLFFVLWLRSRRGVNRKHNP
jgi:tetratricopeptide (TPR) repeat protein